MTATKEPLDSVIKSFFREQPALLFTFCYFIITVLGVVYYSYFYREFGINIIKFSDLSDFLLAAVLEPRSVMLFIALVSFMAILFRTDLYLRKRLRTKGWLFKTKLSNKYIDTLVLGIILLFTANILIKDIALENVKEVKAGIIDEYTVYLADQKTLHSYALLGSSSRFVYLYDVKKGLSMVVPAESISYMVKVQPVIAPKVVIK